MFMFRVRVRVRVTVRVRREEASLIGGQVVYRGKQWKTRLEKQGGSGCRGLECQDDDGHMETLKDTLQS